MVCTKAEAAALPAPLSVFGTSTAAHSINLHKGLTPVVVLSLMWYCSNYTQPAVLYFVLHSVYCACWLMKHMFFRDRNFDEPNANFGVFVCLFLFVDLYWVGPFMLMKYRRDDAILPTWELITALTLYIYGMFLHFTSDAQKFFTLTYRGRGLITSGLFSVVRSPNYLGETLIYMAYCLLTRSQVAWGILFFFVVSIFVPNMKKKDKSLEKYGEEFKRYKANTWMMVPGLF